MKKSLFLLIAVSVMLITLLSSVSVFADGPEGPPVTKSNGTTVTWAGEGSSSETVAFSDSEEAKTYPSAGAESFLNYSFPILVYGLLGIFIVLGLIALSIYFLGKIPSKDEENK